MWLFLQHGDRRLETVRFLLFLHGSGMHGHRTLLFLRLCHRFGGGLKLRFIVRPMDLTNCYFLNLAAITMFFEVPFTCATLILAFQARSALINGVNISLRC